LFADELIKRVSMIKFNYAKVLTILLSQCCR